MSESAPSNSDNDANCSSQNLGEGWDDVKNLEWNGSTDSQEENIPADVSATDSTDQQIEQTQNPDIDEKARIEYMQEKINKLKDQTNQNKKLLSELKQMRLSAEQLKQQIEEQPVELTPDNQPTEPIAKDPNLAKPDQQIDDNKKTDDHEDTKQGADSVEKWYQEYEKGGGKGGLDGLVANLEAQKNNLEQQPKNEENDSKIKEIEDKLDAIKEYKNSLTDLKGAVVDDDKTKRNLAKELGQERLAQELEDTSKFRFLKKVWKGNFAKRYYEAKYGRQAYQQLANADLEQLQNINESKIEGIEANETALIERFVKAAVEDADYLNKGEISNHRAEYLDKGEKINDDSELAGEIKDEIKNYVEELNRAQTSSERQEAERNFQAAIEILKADINEEADHEVDHTMVDNLVDVAQEAYSRVRHGLSIEHVLDGFQLITGEARDNIKSEAHRDAIDKIADRFESHKISNFIPPEVIAGVTGTALTLARSGSSYLMKTAIPVVGGAAVAGIFGAWRERNHVTSERARMSRELVQGADTDRYKEDGNKYEQKLAGTMYATMSANELHSRLQEAIDSGDEKVLLQAYLDAKVRLAYSSEHDVDLVSYSDPAQVGQEKNALLDMMVEVKASMSEEAREQMNRIDVEIRRQSIGKNTLEILGKIEEDVNNKDSAFRKIRRAQAIKQGAKTGATALAGAVVFQEVTALIRPDRYGVLDQVFGLENTNDAHSTMLAGAFGLQNPVVETTGLGSVEAAENIAGGNFTPDGNGRLVSGNGSWIEEVHSTVNKPEVQNVSGDLIDGAKHVSRIDFGSNGTTFSDGNELGLWSSPDESGFMTHMSGNSTTWGGRSINFAQAVQEGRIKGFLTLNGASNPVEMQPEVMSNGQLSWNNSILEQVKDAQGFHGKFFEVAYMDGVNPDGTERIISLATEVGDKTQSTVQQVVSLPKEEITYNVFQPREGMGAILTPFAKRQSVGTTRYAERTDDEPTEAQAGSTSRSEPTQQMSVQSSSAPRTQSIPRPEAAPQPEATAPIEGDTQPIIERGLRIDSHLTPTQERLLTMPLDPEQNQDPNKAYKDFWSGPNGLDPLAKSQLKAAIDRGHNYIKDADGKTLTLSDDFINWFKKQ